MLKVGGVISSLFQLVLGVPKVLSKECLELKLCDWSGALVMALVLGLSKADGAAEEGGSKWGMIDLFGA